MTAILRLPRGAIRLAICAALVLQPATVPAAAQAPDLPAQDNAITADTDREIAIAPEARDAEIAQRLERILKTSGWFDPLAISVSEGIVFLDGRTETDERREWAQKLALRMQGVVAVVNRIEVDRPISWDFTPSRHEIEQVIDQARWFAPITAVSLVILLIFWLSARGAAALARRLLKQRVNSPLLADIAARGAALLVFLIGIYLVLQVAGLTRLAVTVLGGTGLVGIIVGLAFREIAENSLASILLSVRNPFRKGDWIEIGEYQGIVQNLNMRTTILLTLDGNHIQIPNSLVFKSVVTNFSSNPNRRAEFLVGIGYENSIVEAQDLIIATLQDHPAILDNPEPAAIVDELGASSINIRVLFWFDGKSNSIFRLRSSVMRQVKRALQQAGISMPAPVYEVIFPQGVPFHRVAAEGAAGEPEPGRPARSGGEEGATATSGEGDLKSEQGELKRQAAASNVPEAETNLLSPDDEEASAA
jgi:small conductance mechanosensitive channel